MTEVVLQSVSMLMGNKRRKAKVFLFSYTSRWFWGNVYTVLVMEEYLLFTNYNESDAQWKKPKYTKTLLNY